MFVVVSLTPLSTLSNKAILIGFGHAMQFGQRRGAAEAPGCRKKKAAATQKGAGDERKIPSPVRFVKRPFSAPSG